LSEAERLLSKAGRLISEHVVKFQTFNFKMRISDLKSSTIF